MRKYSILLFLLLSFVANAQKIKVQESTEKVGELSRQGMFVLLELDKEEVEKAWVNYLKNYGKPSSKSGIVSMEVAEMKAISSYPCKIVSTVEVSHVGSRVWWAIDLGSKWVTKEAEAEYKGAEKMLYEFAVTAYRDDINRQIVDAEGALISATKIHQKEVEEGLDLVKKIGNNKLDKVELEKKLVENQENYVRLHREIDNNLEEQKIALKNVEEIKASQKGNTEPENKKEKTALSKAMKAQMKKISEGEKMASDLEKNKKDKVNLESDLLKNAADLEQYLKKHEQNIKDQAGAATDVEKMKKALEVVKNKMNSIE